MDIAVVRLQFDRATTIGRYGLLILLGCRIVA